ncbi:MAG: hypothetical protein ABSB78_07555 [Bacteroidota bacterium]
MQRILFDRSIFHGTNFQRLKESGIADNVKARKYKVFLTPMFVEETLMHALNNVSEFKDHWNFIVSLIGQKWFKLAEEIVAIELGDKIKGQNYYLQPKERTRRVIKNVKDLIEGRLPEDELKKALSDIERNEEIRKQFRKTRLALREKVKPEEYDLDSYYESNVEWYIENGLMAYHENSKNYLTTWSANREKCVFTQQFVKAWFATVLLPLGDHQLKVDTNDRSDSEQLAFLTWADMMVSDDTRFMREAFNLLYPNSQKKFLTLDQFLS